MRAAPRRRTAVAWPAGLLAGALLSLGAAPASAADGGIDHVQVEQGSIQVLYSVPGTEPPDLSSVRVSLDGTPLEAEATAASDDSAIRRTTVLAIDVSESMGKGGKFGEAKRAADLFLRSVPDNVYVGVVTFAGRVRVAQAPSLDREASRRVIGRLRLSLGTHLYGGVSKAVDLLGREGQGSVLVLSDGRDTSRTPMTQVTRKIARSRTQVDVVALAQGARDRRLVAPLAAAGGGSVLSASTRQLAGVFSAEAKVLSDQLLITARPPSGTDVREGTLQVGVAAGGKAHTDSAFVTIARTVAPTDRPSPPARAALQPVDTSPLVSRNMLLGGLVAIAAGALVLVLGLVGGLGRKEPSLDERIAAYTGKGAGQGPPAAAPTGARAQAVDMAAKALASNRGFENRLGARLEAAGSALKPAEWLLLHAAVAIGAGGFALLISGGNGGLAFLGLLAGLVVPWVHLGMKKGRRLKAFNAQLPGTLQLMAGSLQAGLSLGQGIDTIVREGADPVAGEFRRALVETRLGVQVEDALDSVAERMQSDDFRWTVMAIRIQREVGGNLAQLMLNVAATMREREYLRRQVRSLSAEGKFSAYILLAMPPAVLAFEMVSNGDYVAPLFSTAIGWVLLAAMGLLMGMGAFMMSRMIKLEV